MKQRKELSSCQAILDQLHGTLAGTQGMYFQVAEHLGMYPELQAAMRDLARAHEKPLSILEGRAKPPLVIPGN
jgi:hypothetical protein